MGGDFEAMVRAAGRPAERDELPPPAGPPSPEQAAVFTELCAEHGIDDRSAAPLSLRAARRPGGAHRPGRLAWLTPRSSPSAR